MTAEKLNNNKPLSPMEKLKSAPPRYKVMVDDNFHYQNEDERWEYGIFLAEEEAIAACKRIVDSDLKSYLKPGMTATELYELYTLFGDDPFIVCVNPAGERVPADERVRFSAWDYAGARSKAITSHGKVRKTDAGSVDKTNPDVDQQPTASRAKDVRTHCDPVRRRFSASSSVFRCLRA